MLNFKIAALAALALVGCSERSPVVAENPEIQMRKGGLGDKGDRGNEITKEEARDRAAEFISGKNWGEPTSVGEQGNSYIVFFSTPKKELTMVGPRSLLVNKKTGAVEYQRRR